MSDKDRAIRKRAVDQILQIRHNESMIQLAKADQDKIRKAKLCQFKQQRVFTKPKVNYEAASYLDVILWESQAIYKPPLTHKMTDSEIHDFITSPLNLDIVSHSVQTERTIKIENKSKHDFLKCIALSSFMMLC